MSKLWTWFGATIIFCAFFITYQPACGQTIADTLEFEEIEVVATRIQQPLSYQPTNVEVVDSSRLSLLGMQSVGEVLTAHSSIHIKEYGPGGMATASQRGLSSEQIQVLWEGIPINSSTLGQTDLSLLPASFFSDIQVSSGTPSTAFGGGSLSGALYLGSDWKGGNFIKTEQGIGSYGHWQSSLQGRYQSNGWLVSVRGLYDYADNDYSYYNRAYNEDRKRQHNRTKRYNMMATVGKVQDDSRWKSTFWLAGSDNQIPGSVLKTNSQARQVDKSARWLSTYRHNWTNTEWKLKNYLSRTALNYFDPEIDTRSFTTTRRWLVSSDLKHSFNDHLLLKGELSGELTGVDTPNYNSLKTRQQFSVLTNPEIILFNRRLRLYPALRLDAYNDFGTVLSPSLGANYELIANDLFLRGQLSRDFNPPTFNALYWGQGGNPNLKAEYSRSAEVGLTVKPHLWLGFESIKVTAYYNNIENGIRWHPNAGGVFTPSNVSRMLGRGVETQTEHQWYLPYHMQLQLSQSLSFNRTEVSDRRSTNDAAVGSQVRYVPQWKYNGALALRKGIFTALLRYRWISRRYVTETEDMNSSLDPYGVVDARLQLQKKFQNVVVEARAGMNNILSEDYEILQWYAMPQRNYTFSLTATYQF